MVRWDELLQEATSASKVNKPRVPTEGEEGQSSVSEGPSGRSVTSETVSHRSGVGSRHRDHAQRTPWPRRSVWEKCHERDSVPQERHWLQASRPRSENSKAEKVRLGEVSRARQCPTGAALAAGIETTFRELQGREGPSGRSVKSETVSHRSALAPGTQATFRELQGREGLSGRSVTSETVSHRSGVGSRHRGHVERTSRPRRSVWEKCHERDSVSQERRWLQAPRPRSENSKAVTARGVEASHTRGRRVRIRVARQT